MNKNKNKLLRKTEKTRNSPFQPPKKERKKKIYERQEGTKAPERTSLGFEAKAWEYWNSSEKWIWNWEFGSQMRTVSQTRK